MCMWWYPVVDNSGLSEHLCRFTSLILSASALASFATLWFGLTENLLNNTRNNRVSLQAGSLSTGVMPAYQKGS